MSHSTSRSVCVHFVLCFPLSLQTWISFCLGVDCWTAKERVKQLLLEEITLEDSRKDWQCIAIASRSLVETRPFSALVFYLVMSMIGQISHRKVEIISYTKLKKKMF